MIRLDRKANSEITRNLVQFVPLVTLGDSVQSMGLERVQSKENVGFTSLICTTKLNITSVNPNFNHIFIYARTAFYEEACVTWVFCKCVSVGDYNNKVCYCKQTTLGVFSSNF